MSQERYHYESAFAEMLRAHRVPFVGVDEARRTLLPRGGPLDELKSFDFVVYGARRNFLVDVKGRRTRGAALPSWATREDVDSLLSWERLFGAGFEGLLVFMYDCEEQPPDGLFDEVFAHTGRWFCFRAVSVRDFSGVMRTRSTRWRTVDITRRDLDRLRLPFPPWSDETPLKAAANCA